MSPERETLVFNSQEPLPEVMRSSNAVANKLPMKEITATDDSPFADISAKLRRVMDIDLFGYDCVVDSATGKCFVVDVNYLPGYSGVDGLFDILVEYLEKRVVDFRTNRNGAGAAK